MRELLSQVWRVKAAGLQFSRQDCVSVLLSLFVWMIQKSQQVCVFVDLKSKRKDTAFVRVCVCVWMTVCVSSSTDASGPTECEMEQGGSDFSRNSLQHTHTLTHAISFCFDFLLFFCFPLISTLSLLLSLFSCLLPLFLLSFHIFHCHCISPSLLYSTALSVWIKLSLLWSLFFPLLCLYLPFGWRVWAAAWRERGRQHPHVRPVMD